MQILLVGVIAATAGSILGSAAGTVEPLALEASIPLGPIPGRIDRLAYDSKRGRLIVAELGNDSVSIVDLDQRTVVHRISGLHTPQGVAYFAANDTMYVTSAGDGTVRRFKAANFTEGPRTNLGDDADGIRIDPTSNQAMVGYGPGGLALLQEAIEDPSASKRKKPPTGFLIGKSNTESPAKQAKKDAGRTGIVLPVHPEGFQLDTGGQRLFVNLAELGEVGVVDRSSGKLIARWSVPGLGANFPMAIDEPDRRVLAVFRRPPRLVAFNADNGVVAAMLDVCGDPDDIFGDAKRQRLYVTCGDGAVDVLDQDGAGYRRSGRVASARGARTGLFVAERDRLYVAAPATATGPAAILVFLPKP
jgi:hypothetical protein